MKEIRLTKGMVAMVDDSDYDFLSQFKWGVNKSNQAYYAAHYFEKNGKRFIYRMHRFILGLKDHKLFVDHINGNTLDNRRENLRICTHAENVRNRRIQKNNTSGFRGVVFTNGHPNKPWRATLRIDKKRFHLGYFATPEAAALAYNEAAMKYHGEFARLNDV